MKHLVSIPKPLNLCWWFGLISVVGSEFYSEPASISGGSEYLRSNNEEYIQQRRVKSFGIGSYCRDAPQFVLVAESE